MQLRLTAVETTRNGQLPQYSDDFDDSPAIRRRFEASSPGSAGLMMSRHATRAAAAPSSELTHWLRSSKNLDFCLLAFCSCVLAVLCHQTVVPSTTSAAATGGAVQSSSQIVRLADLNLIFKAGLFTSSNRDETSDREADQSTP